MKLIAAQIASIPGEIGKNISKHLDVIRLAASKGADVLVFPELSLTGYEPGLAGALAVHPTDRRFDEFQVLSDRHGMLIAVGAPTKGAKGTEISMICFQPGLERSTYSSSIYTSTNTLFSRPALNSSCLERVMNFALVTITYTDEAS
ncbi:nitrilase-related carbon-nitrogen hydrolase [Xanthomonas hortorum]|uniref:nitrilase-related carbon-nitrogen hydrolase n=1 Tax=Xanthomonas hortorum TaxID=56454 RepID=UPI001F464654|nr:nitrilase-related carbon-nitrogen hydrolase [Xanthomonas hortorum]MCE4513905.1 hypothetical protein [Xanthomonas hortorum pv. vitians]MCE4522398.1 hypothetical protein [Xanthomonas hortorum pv. vitians]